MVARSDWGAVTGAFERFFEGLGSVHVGIDSVEFVADPSIVATSLELDADGSSRSFMPLHEMTTSWEEVLFDEEGLTVTLICPAATYVYRVPPALVR